MKKIEITNPDGQGWAERIGITEPGIVVLNRMDHRFPELVAELLWGGEKDTEEIVCYCSEIAQDEREFALLLIHCYTTAMDTREDPIMLMASRNLYLKMKSGKDLTRERANFEDMRLEELARQTSQTPQQ